MNRIEIEQLKNNLETKVGVLEIRIKNGEITDDDALDIVQTFKDFEKVGTTIEELKLLYEDVVLALDV